MSSFVFNYSSQATTKINLALSQLPNFQCIPNVGRDPLPHHGTTIHLGASSMADLHGSFKESIHTGSPSVDNPLMIEMTIPSAIDPTLAPTGCHVATLFIQWTPYKHFANISESGMTAFTDRVLETIEAYCPGFRKSVLHMDVLTPSRLEQEFGLTGGNIFHGSMSLDQLYWTRPTAFHGANGRFAGGYRTPLKGYYLCGSGAHPGGGVMGSPGRICAKSVLADQKV